MDDEDITLTPFQVSLVRQLVRGPMPRHIAYEHEVAITEVTLMEIVLYEKRWRPKTEADFDTGALWLSRYEAKELRHGCRVSRQGVTAPSEPRSRREKPEIVEEDSEPPGPLPPIPRKKREKKAEKLSQASPTKRPARTLNALEQQVVDTLNANGALVPPWVRQRAVGKNYSLLLDSKFLRSVSVLHVAEMIAGGIIAWVKEGRYTVLRASGPYRKAS